jgi:hypothetical protein
MDVEMNGGRLFRRPKLTLSCSAEGKEGRKELLKDKVQCQVFVVVIVIGLEARQEHNFDCGDEPSGYIKAGNF